MNCDNPLWMVSVVAVGEHSAMFAYCPWNSLGYPGMSHKHETY